MGSVMYEMYDLLSSFIQKINNMYKDRGNIIHHPHLTHLINLINLIEVTK